MQGGGVLKIFIIIVRLLFQFLYRKILFQPIEIESPLIKATSIQKLIVILGILKARCSAYWDRCRSTPRTTRMIDWWTAT